MTNFEQWSGRREGIVTSENYSSKQAFDRTLDDLWDTDFKWSDELNPDIPRLDFLGDIIAGKEKGFYYARSDHVNFDNLERMLTAIETGRLSQADSFGAKVFASGMAAITAALKSLSAGKDGVFITGKVMYSSTKAILEDEGNGRNAIGTYPGITVDLNVPGALEAAIKEQK
ncbi:PLP-dependent transferase, partial [Candidatus Woesearchaeota archaeon]|nr:PLP-dependent transferase [Candidatus Woesearchaeota archaeon]